MHALILGKSVLVGMSQDARVDRRAAQTFCRTHGPGGQERLAQALHTLQAQHESVTVAAVCHLAGVSGKQASAFLQAIRGTEQERLATALATGDKQSEQIGIRRLAHAAPVNTLAASTFVLEHAETQQATLVLVG